MCMYVVYIHHLHKDVEWSLNFDKTRNFSALYSGIMGTKQKTLPKCTYKCGKNLKQTSMNQFIRGHGVIATSKHVFETLIIYICCCCNKVWTVGSVVEYWSRNLEVTAGPFSSQSGHCCSHLGFIGECYLVWVSKLSQLSKNLVRLTDHRNIYVLITDGVQSSKLY